MQSSQKPAPIRADRTTPEQATRPPRLSDHATLTAEELREIVVQILG